MVHSDADPETSRFKFIMWNWPLVYQENCCKKIAIGKAVDEVKNGLGRTANGRNNRQMEKQRKENKKVFF